MLYVFTNRAQQAPILASAILALGLVAGTADAAVFTVGNGTACTHGTVQAAVDAAHATPGADTIRISRTVSWTAQQISIQTDQDLELIGGFPSCGTAAPDSTRTILSGAGGQARPVLTVRGNGITRLRNLTIRDGDQAGDDIGGGIFFEGGGILDIADTTITNNAAHAGGGIYATGTTSQAELVLGANVLVSSNTARNSGGGIVAKSITMRLHGPGSMLASNTAQGSAGGGNGGGLVVVSEQFPSYAFISSNGIGGLGAIWNNTAVNGGGIAVLGGVGSGLAAEARIFSTDSANPVRINGNRATSRGGGIYAKPDADLTSGDAYAAARLWYVAIADNTAPDGAAVYLDYDPGGLFGDPQGGEIHFNMNLPPPAAAVLCPVGRPCGYITGNYTNNSTGAIVSMPGGLSYFVASRLVVEGNEGGRLFLQNEQDDEGGRAELNNSLITGNTVAQELFRLAGGQGNLALRNVTVADNTVGAPHLLYVDSHLTLNASLFAQPGKQTRAFAGGVGEIGFVLTNDTTNLLPGAALATPRFVDPANGDYRLRAGSRAIDYAPTSLPPGVGTTDLDNRSRTVDVPIAGVATPGRIRDVGAYERPALQPLVLNGDFDVDLNLWDTLSDSVWDGSQNASGPADSGSVRIPYIVDPGRERQAGRSQCIHLPGPGVYALNGWGRVVPASQPLFGVNNRARLTWELRYNGGATGCEDGVANLSGVHQLATGSTWTRPASPALINVPAAAWTFNTSLTVKLDVLQLGPGQVPAAWFDGITLEIDGDDTIFADGFE